MEFLNRVVIASLPMVPKYFVGRIASRYIAGSTLSDAIATVRELNAKGVMATIDLLGEDTTQREQAEEAAKVYHQILEAIKREGISSNVSLKPTHFGLKLGYDFCAGLVAEVVAHVAESDSFLRIDMEDRSTTDDTLKLYHQMRARYEGVGIVIQAYLRRTINDIQRLKEEKANIRLCKAIYRDPR